MTSDITMIIRMRTLPSILFCILICLMFPKYGLAIGGLNELQDLINNTSGTATNVEHQISFTLPYNALQISTSDYIIVDLSAFSDVTIATALDGIYGGTPTFSLSGTDVKITGITLLPGYSLTINGITATNPAHQAGYQVTVVVAEDSAGSIIKNVASTRATGTPGSITVSATVDPPVASLSITGYSAPGTFVTFTDSGSVIGTDSAGPTGFFSQLFTGLQPATHSLRIYGVDQLGRATAPIFLSVYTPIYQQTSISNILLPPTLELDENSISPGTDLIAFGTSVPNGTLTLLTDSPLRSYSAAVDSAGDWNYTITDTSDYIPGDYRAYGIVQSGVLQSLASTAIGFTILSSGGLTPTPAGCNISHGDLNCDNIVNLNDFSILMFYWGTNQTAADVNSDSLINLTDFSIMMYYWGGS